MKIGIIGVIDKEIEKFIDLYDLAKEDTNRDIYIGKTDNKEIILAQSSIGKVNAASITQYIIDKYEVDLIVSTGCASSLDQNVKIMHVVIADTLSYYDFLNENSEIIKIDEDLKSKLIRLLDYDTSIIYHLGNIVSGDININNPYILERIKNETNALAIDIEGTAIAHVARINDVPFIVIRTISDGVDFDLVASYKTIYIVKQLIDEL